MRINNNLMAMNTHRQLGAAGNAGAKSMEKLSSGMRINRAGDDAAGLAISEKMRGQIRGLNQASSNAQDGISMVQTAEGALNETHAILQRMRELAVQSANDTNVSVDRSEIQKEVDQLAIEITRIANNTEFNTQKLTNGGITDDGIGEVKFHIGANSGQNVGLSINAMDAKTLGVSRDVSEQAKGTLASGGDEKLTSVSFDKTVGTGIVDKAEITFSYAAGQTATQSTITGAGTITEGTDLTTGGDTKMTIDVGGTAYTVDLSTWDGTSGTKATLAAAIAGATDTNGVRLDTVASVTQDGTNMKIELNDAGDTAVTVSYSGGAAAAAATATGIAAASTDTGDKHIDAVVTITNGTNTQHVNVSDDTVNELKVSTGAFAGMTIGTGADTLADIHNDDKITVAADTKKASEAKFSGGALVDDAKTDAGIDVSTQSQASAAITTINNAIETVSAERSKLGAMQNRLEHTIKNLDTSSENLQASEARIRDVDMAKEMMEQTKQNILQQASTAMLAQANQAPQAVLQLLR